MYFTQFILEFKKLFNFFDFYKFLKEYGHL